MKLKRRKVIETTLFADDIDRTLRIARELLVNGARAAHLVRALDFHLKKLGYVAPPAYFDRDGVGGKS